MVVGPRPPRTAAERRVERGNEMFGAGNNPLGINSRVRMDQQGPQALEGVQGADAEGALDPSKMDIKKLLEEIMKVLQQLMAGQAEGQGAEGAQGGPQGGGGQKTGGAEGVGNPIKLLEALMNELRKRNPQAIEQAAQGIPGAPQAMTAAENALSAASAPTGIPGGFM